MRESQKHYPKWKKPDTNGQILRFHVYEMSIIGKSIDTESRLMVSNDWGKEGMDSDCIMGMMLLSGGD